MGELRSWQQVGAAWWARLCPAVWTIVGVGSAVVLLARLFLSGDIVASLLVPVFLYAVFILEGIQVAAIQLDSVDRQGLEEFLKKDKHIGEMRKADVLHLRDELSPRFDDFVVGRQIFTIVAVVGLAYAMRRAAVPAEHLTRILGPDGGTVASITNHWSATLVISSLVPAWVSQLLPQFMSNKRAVEFAAAFPFSSWFVVKSAVILAALGAGRPGQWLFGMMRKTGHFNRHEQIPLGAEKLFSQTADYHGSHIESLEIDILVEEDKCVVTEAALLAFTGGSRREVTYGLRARNVVGEVNWLFPKSDELPDGVKRGKGQAMKQTLVTYVPKEEGGASAEADRRWEETTAAAMFPLNVAIPRVAGIAEMVRLSASYTALPFSLTKKANRFYVDITRPTKRLTVTIRSVPELVVQHPEVRSGLSGELIGTVDSDSLRVDGSVSEGKERGEWVYAASYPPIGNRYVMSLAVFRTVN